MEPFQICIVGAVLDGVFNKQHCVCMYITLVLYSVHILYNYDNKKMEETEEKKDKTMKKKVLKTIEAMNSWVGGMKRRREKRESERRKEKIMDS